MIEFVSGDFFEFDADIRINTVNCVGVMGAGVALAFKQRYPRMFDDYVIKCRAGVIRPGLPSVWIQEDMLSKEVEIVNFPTKDHWRKPSEYSYIDDGLIWLANYLKDKAEKIVTLPALGCGHGQLEWEKVRGMIVDRLKESPAKIYVFEPSDSLNAAKTKGVEDDYASLLSTVNASVVNSSSKDYPSGLRSYTNKSLFYYPFDKRNFDYDYSLVCSSKPLENEVAVIKSFLELCLERKQSVLLGATAFEKKLAVEFAKKGLACGCGLPSGIYESAKKISAKQEKVNPRLVSIGAPMVAFDRKEFIPSVMMRVHLASTVVFFAGKLAWLSKHKKHFLKNSIDSYYFPSDESSPKDIDAVLDIGAKSFSLETLPLQ
jgi:O-acetyl-ADP-ribose deacetylase (regulator of RNase III)